MLAIACTQTSYLALVIYLHKHSSGVRVITLTLAYATPS